MAEEEVIEVGGEKVESSELDHIKVEEKRVSLDVGGGKQEVNQLVLTDNDKVLLIKTRAMIDDCQAVHKDRIEHFDDNDKFFDGDIWKGERTGYHSDVHLNLIMPATRSQAGLLTDSQPEPMAQPPPSDNLKEYNQNNEVAKTVERCIGQRWKEIEGQNRLVRLCYYILLYEDGYAMPFWNEDDDDVDFEVLKPHQVLLPPSAENPDSASYVIIERLKSRQWIRENYPKQVNKVKFTTASVKRTSDWYAGKGESQSGGGSRIENVAVVHEILTKEARIVKAGNVILDKEVNPYWADEYRQASESVSNFFDSPQIPLIPFNSMDLGERNSRSILNQLKPVQRAIDRRKQQIDENATLMGNGQIIYDSSRVSKKEIEEKITNEPGLLIGVPGGSETIQRDTPSGLPQYISFDLDHSKVAFDNIVGHHDISRGQKPTRQTATEAAILKESDVTPIRLISREIDSGLSQLFRWWVHLMKLYYNQAHYIEKVGVSETMEIESLTQGKIPDGLRIGVKDGSTMPINKQERRQDAIQLAQMQLLDPLSLFEILEFPSPEKYAQRLQEWMGGQIEQQDESKMKEELAKGVAKGGGEGEEGGMPPGAEEAMMGEEGMPPEEEIPPEEMPPPPVE